MRMWRSAFLTLLILSLFLKVAEPNHLQPCNGYTCFDGTCVDYKDFVRCDGITDCFDGSDERDGCYSSFCPGGFGCHNYERCLPLSDRCDGQEDCSDGSDESDVYCDDGVTSFIALIAGITGGAVFLTIVVPIGILVLVVCCKACRNAARRHNVTNTVLNAPPTLITTTAAEKNVGSYPTQEMEAYPPQGKLEQEPPPQYSGYPATQPWYPPQPAYLHPEQGYLPQPVDKQGHPPQPTDCHGSPPPQPATAD